MRQNLTKNQGFLFFSLVFLGFFIRFFLLPFPGHEHDMAFWKSWSLYAADKGPVELISTGNWYNYPSFFAVFMYLLGLIFRLFQNPYLVESYWSTTNFAYLLLFKGILITADALISFLIYKIAKQNLSQKLALGLGLLFFLSPVAIFDSSFWGQVDGLGFSFLLLSYFLLTQKKPCWASFIFVIGFLFKLQNIIFIPLFYLYILKSYGQKGLCRSLLTSFLAFVMCNLPILLQRKAELVLASFNKNIDYYPYFSLKAYNLWSLFMKSGYWDNYPDQMLILGITSAKTLGMFLFIISYLLATVLVLTATSKEALKRLVLASCLAIFSFFTVLTQMHDRYLFSFFPLLILLFIFSQSLQKHSKLFFLGFFILNLLYFSNLYASFSFQYQYLGLKFFDFVNGRPFSLFVSLTITTAFLAFFIYSLRSLPKAATLILLLLPGFLFWQNLTYLKGKPISLSQFLASNWSQSYGRPMKNMNVNSFRGPFQWERLTNNYFFYDQGIGVHSNSEIYFYINGKFARFETDYGVDNQAGPQSKMVFQVIGNNKVLFTSKALTKSALPQHLNLNINNVNKLILKVTESDDGINGDHANWLNPVFYR